MNTLPCNRTQGGIFIWLCSLFFATIAAASVVRSSEGFGRLFVDAFVAIGVAFAVRTLAVKSVRSRGGSPEAEKGPMLGLAVVGASACFSGFRQFVWSGSDRLPLLVMGLVCSAFAILVSFAVLSVGRGLNRYDMNLGGCFRREWAGMNRRTRMLCLSFFGLPAAETFVFMVATLANGLRFEWWELLANTVIAAGVFLALIAGLRRIICGLAFRIADGGRRERLRPADLRAAWGDSFSVPEYCAAIMGGSSSTLAFAVLPGSFRSCYFPIMLFGAAMAFAVLVLVLRVDRNRQATLFRSQWRAESESILAEWLEERSRRESTAVMNLISGKYRNGGGGSWGDDTVLRDMADHVRKHLNATFCGGGAMKYVSRCCFADRGDVIADCLEGAWDARRFVPDPGDGMDGLLSDAELLKRVDALKADPENGGGPSAEDSAKVLFADLESGFDWSCVQPRCRMSLDFRGDGLLRSFLLEFSKDGRCSLSTVDGSSTVMVRSFGLSEMDSAIEAALTDVGIPVLSDQLRDFRTDTT